MEVDDSSYTSSYISQSSVASSHDTKLFVTTAPVVPPDVGVPAGGFDRGDQVSAWKEETWETVSQASSIPPSRARSPSRSSASSPPRFLEMVSGKFRALRQWKGEASSARGASLMPVPEAHEEGLEYGDNMADIAADNMAATLDALGRAASSATLGRLQPTSAAAAPRAAAARHGMASDADAVVVGAPEPINLDRFCDLLEVRQMYRAA